MDSDVAHSKDPVRLFRSDLMERFTHTPPWMVPAIWLPVAALFTLWRPGAYTVLTFALGMACWSPAEYLLHRFLFHWRPRTPRQERFIFMIHGIHHAQPMVKTRLVMPPAAAIPLAAIFYALFWLIIGLAIGRPLWVGPFFGGFLAAYVVYDLLHYAFHHVRVPGRYLHTQRRRHMRHHTAVTRLFGVTSRLWDRVLGTDLDVTPARR